MKTKINLITCLILLLVLSAKIVCGQEKTDDNSEIDPATLLRTADEEIFKLRPTIQNFSEAQGYVNELPNPTTIHQYYIYDGQGTDLLMSMMPAVETIKTTNKRCSFENLRTREFHVSYSMMQEEEIPMETGGRCWMGYTNAVVQGKGNESGVILYPGDAAYFFSPSEEVIGEKDYQWIGDLSFLDRWEMVRFDFIRLNGTTFFYADGEFIFSYNDGIKDVVSFEGGAELYEGGNRVRCTFDDFSIKTK